MSDWLSPILVKELRQGMRARVFEGAFILLQLCMVIAVSVAVMATASNKGHDAATAAQVLFWVMIGLPVVLVMPLRGSAALRSEIDGRTLELIFLTRLSAWRIVFGKWAALYMQTLLLVVAVLPYVVLRYYLGGTEVVRELVVLLSMLGASALLSAFTVAGSAYTSKLARGLVILVPLFLIYGIPLAIGMFLDVYGMSGHATMPLSPVMLYGAIVFYGLVAFFFMLETGAARIAPLAENHAVRKRGLGLILILSGPPALLLGYGREILFLNLVLALPVLVDALCTPYQPLPSHRRVFRRLGPLGRMLAPLLVPGWPSAFLFTLFAYLLCLAMIFFTGQLDTMNLVIALVSTLGALLLPLALVLLVCPQPKRLGMLYIGIQLALLIVTMFTFLICQLFDFDVLPVLSVLPLSTLVMFLFGEIDGFWLAPTAAVTAASLVLITRRLQQRRNRERRTRAPAPAAAVETAS